MSINVFEWITCPECAYNFQVAISKDVVRLFAVSKLEDEEYQKRHKDAERTQTRCPKCENMIFLFHIFNTDK
jgi:hypothetical protein